MSQNPNHSRVVLPVRNGQNVSLAAYKSVVSDYSLRLRQAEELTAKLLMDRLTKDELVNIVGATVKEHLATRGLERSTQLLGVIQTTLLALTNIHRQLPTLPTQELDSELITIIKALTVASNPS